MRSSESDPQDEHINVVSTTSIYRGTFHHPPNNIKHTCMGIDIQSQVLWRHFDTMSVVRIAITGAVGAYHMLVGCLPCCPWHSDCRARRRSAWTCSRTRAPGTRWSCRHSYRWISAQLAEQRHVTHRPGATCEWQLQLPRGNITCICVRYMKTKDEWTTATNVTSLCTLSC